MNTSQLFAWWATVLLSVFGCSCVIGLIVMSCVMARERRAETGQRHCWDWTPRITVILAILGLLALIAAAVKWLN